MVTVACHDCHDPPKSAMKKWNHVFFCHSMVTVPSDLVLLTIGPKVYTWEPDKHDGVV